MGTDYKPISYSVNGTLTSPKFCEAFANGCGGRLCTDPSMLWPGPVAMFGHPILYPLLRQAITEGRDWYYGDHAYFGRGKYYRITRNSFQHPMTSRGERERFNNLGVHINPWRVRGKHILICLQSSEFYGLHGLDRDVWLNETVAELRKYTGRPIEIRERKVGGPGTETAFRRSLSDVYAVVVYTSVAGVHAVLEGVPCFATHNCVSKHFGTSDLSRIEDPVKPDNRYEMACLLADNQWTFDEIRSGMAWEFLK